MDNRDFSTCLELISLIRRSHDRWVRAIEYATLRLIATDDRSVVVDGDTFDRYVRRYIQMWRGKETQL